MKNALYTKPGLLAVATALLGSLAATQAGSFSSDFNSGLPADAAVYGVATAAGSGGYTNSGCVQLTQDAGSQHGTFIITNDLDAGTPAVSFTASFKVMIGGNQRGNYADGMSFNFAPDLTLGTWGLEDEGSGSGLTIDLDTFGGAGDPWPAARVTVNHTQVGASETYMDHLRAGVFVDAVVQLNPNQTLDFIYDGVYVCSNLDLSAYGYAPALGSLFGWGARTGGAWESHFVDDLNIVTRTAAAPYVNSFAPRGRQAGSAIDVVLTDYSTQVDTNTIVLKLDGGTVIPAITQDGAGNTTLHFAPGSAFAASSQHSVSLTFSDNANPTPQRQSFSWQFTVAETVPTDYVTVFSDGFESYAAGPLDKNAGGANGAPNGSGNPWFGPYPDNYSVLGSATLVVDGTNVDVMPHSGTNMMTRSYYQYLCTIWVNLAYRCHGGQPIKGNCRLDWWVFDANDQANPYEDYVSLYYYNVVPTPSTADWPAAYDSGAGLYWDYINWGDDNAYQSVSLGGGRYNPAGGSYDAAKYQIRLEELPGYGTYGNDGWVNTISRSPGWHHERVVFGSPHADGTVTVWIYVDDMANPVYSGSCSLGATGFALIEVDSGLNTTPSYYDDFSFALVRPPAPLTTVSGSHVILTWAGEGFTLQSAPTPNGPWSDITGAASGYSYDTTTGSLQFFRLKN